MTAPRTIYPSVSPILQLFRPSIGDVRRHYGNHEGIAEELTNLLTKVLRSENCKVGVEFIMCLDEFRGGYFGMESARVVDNLRGAEDSVVKWVGIL